jgi:hypothetical protein
MQTSNFLALAKAVGGRKKNFAPLKEMLVFNKGNFLEMMIASKSSGGDIERLWLVFRFFRFHSSRIRESWVILLRKLIRSLLLPPLR